MSSKSSKKNISFKAIYAVLGVALTNVQEGNNFITAVVTGFGTACGFAVAIIILAGIREKTEHNDIIEK